MGTKLHKMPGYIKEMVNYKAFKKQLKSFLSHHAFYSVEKFVSFNLCLMLHLAAKYTYFYKHIIFSLKYFVEG
jgi:hypothetical protein